MKLSLLLYFSFLLYNINCNATSSLLDNCMRGTRSRITSEATTLQVIQWLTGRSIKGVVIHMDS